MQFQKTQHFETRRAAGVHDTAQVSLLLIQRQTSRHCICICWKEHQRIVHRPAHMLGCQTRRAMLHCMSAGAQQGLIADSNPQLVIGRPQGRWPTHAPWLPSMKLILDCLSGGAGPTRMLCTMQCMCLSGFGKHQAAGTDQCTLHGGLAPLLLKVLRRVHLHFSLASLLLLLSGFLLSLEVLLAQLLLLHGPKALQRTTPISGCVRLCALGILDENSSRCADVS